ncbi:MAG: hypothetical protein CVU56_19440 [Deltaproteobacteria bacterium HGW-Deltaproteobacteria-14]|jgi:NAD(P)H-flavin reductase|nr:MAG: hypothetical protein CVU56_19440 [Deltaproteobacteria bacterium HGW-Deltaproteobacteria-14]
MTSEAERVPLLSPDTGPRLVGARWEGPGLRRVHVAVAPGVGFAYVPGQVAMLGVAGRERGIFAIASAPHEPGPLTFLIKDGGSAAATGLLDAEPGARLVLEGPLGGGFDLTDAAASDVLLVGVGTGIAPLRSVLAELLVTPGRAGDLALVHGVRHTSQLCFADDHGGWRAAGVRVRLVASRPAVSDCWQGRVGRVQRHLADLVTPATLAFIAGMDEMMAETRAALLELGLDPGRIRTNLG